MKAILRKVIVAMVFPFLYLHCMAKGSSHGIWRPTSVWRRYAIKDNEMFITTQQLFDVLNEVDQYRIWQNTNLTLKEIFDRRFDIDFCYLYISDVENKNPTRRRNKSF